MPGGGYDAVIIGAGIGGLFCANFLAQSGRRVLVLERHRRPGGCTSGFSRRGYWFDAGAQALASNGILFPLLAKLGLTDSLTFHRCGYRLVSPRVDFCLDSLDAIKAGLVAGYPQAAPALRTFLAELAELAGTMESILLKFANPSLEQGEARRAAQAAWLRGNMQAYRRYPHYQRQPAGHWLRQRLPEPELVYLFDNLGLGLAGQSMATYGACLVSYLEDTWYPAGGMQRLADVLAANLERLGGTVVCGAAVDGLAVAAGAVRGVTRGGEEIRAHQIINATDLKTAVTSWMPAEIAAGQWARSVAAAPVTPSILSVYLGLDCQPEKLEGYLKRHHVWIFPLACWPERRLDHPRAFELAPLALASPSLSDPGLAPAGKSVLILQSFASWDWQGGWGLAAGPGGYARLKEQAAADLVRAAAGLIPGLESMIEVREVATPATYRRYTGNYQGASSGWWPTIQGGVAGTDGGVMSTPLANFYQVGHWATPTGGIQAVALGSKLLADHLLAG